MEVPGAYEIAHPTSSGDLVLKPGQVDVIRKALVIGLHCYGEVERLPSRAAELRARGESIDNDSVPWIPPGGVDGAIRKFAAALSALESAG